MKENLKDFDNYGSDKKHRYELIYEQIFEELKEVNLLQKLV